MAVSWRYLMGILGVVALTACEDGGGSGSSNGGGGQPEPAEPNVFYFAGNNGSNGWELWTTSGTEASTRMVQDIHPGGDSEPFWFRTVGNRVLFQANDGVHGYELWSSDGTTSFF